MVIAKRKGFHGTRRFDFEVKSENPKPKGQLRVELRELPVTAQRQVAVAIDVTREREGSPKYEEEQGTIKLLCNVSRRLLPCESFK